MRSATWLFWSRLEQLEQNVTDKPLELIGVELKT
jgi:hypothetical protein